MNTTIQVMGKRRLIEYGLLLVILLFSSMDAAATSREEETVARKYCYKSLTGYQLSLLEGFISSEFPAGKSIHQILTNEESLRNATRLAQALLFRNKPGDKENSAEILKWILNNQYTNDKSENYGMWKTNVGNDRLDKNWREFIGCDLILIYQEYRDLLPAQVVAGIKNGLIHAAKGALKRDVGADYTNIAIMSALLMNYTGTAFQMEELKKGGSKKAREIYRLYQQHRTFSEYNSPTYNGVTMIGLALWRELGSSQLKKMGAELEYSLWLEIADNYNPNLKNFVGPYFRGYGMDIKKYYAITAIWIAIALDEQKFAPLPAGRGEKEAEMSNISPILHLGLSVPKPVMISLKAFTPGPLINRIVPSKIPGDSLKQVTAFVGTNWMMGGLWGNRRDWNQIKVGTIHWNNQRGETEWLLVPGEGTTNVRVTETAMSIYRADEKSTVFSVYVYTKDITEENFTEKSWKFPAMELTIHTSLTRSYRKITDHTILYEECAIAEEVPAVMKITFQVPPSWDNEKPLIEIIPAK